LGVAASKNIAASSRAMEPVPIGAESEQDQPPDVFETYVSSAIQGLKADAQTIGRLKAQGMPWKGVQVRIAELLPDVINDRDNVAYSIVPQAMNNIFGEGGWDTERRPSRSGNGTTTWIVVRDTTRVS